MLLSLFIDILNSSFPRVEVDKEFTYLQGWDTRGLVGLPENVKFIYILEIFSRIRPIASSILMIPEIADPRKCYNKRIMATLKDESFRVEVCLTSVLKVGVLCSVEMPEERIGINVAIKKLHVAQDEFLHCK